MNSVLQGSLNTTTVQLPTVPAPPVNLLVGWQFNVSSVECYFILIKQSLFNNDLIRAETKKRHFHKSFFFPDKLSTLVKRANVQVTTSAEHSVTLSGSEIHCSGPTFSSAFASNTCLNVRNKVIQNLAQNPFFEPSIIIKKWIKKHNVEKKLVV